MASLLVNEIFETIQGEGSFTGTPAIFVRLQGCPVGCPWCDTQHTWDILPENEKSAERILVKTEDTPTYFASDAQNLFQIITRQAYTAKHVVITGGEPCMFDLTSFTQILVENGYSTQIETSGTYHIKCHDQTWVTVSPKIDMRANMPILPQAMQRANEIKHPVAMQKHIDELDALLLESYGQHFNTNNTMPKIYLQPISQLPRATDLAVATCIKRNWCLSVQLHKYIGVE